MPTHFKVKIQCKSVLLQNTLLNYLGAYIAPTRNYDIVVSDHPIKTNKKNFIIADHFFDNQDTKVKPHLHMPFGSKELISTLETFFAMQYAALPNQKPKVDQVAFDHQKSLEQKIHDLMKEYTKQLIFVIKNHQSGH